MNDIARISMISWKQPKIFCECERDENRDDFRYRKFIYLHCCEEMLKSDCEVWAVDPQSL